MSPLFSSASPELVCFFLPVAEKKVSSSVIFTRLMNTLCLWLFLTVCESLPRCLDSVSCFLFRQVPPHVSCLSFLSLSLVDCPDDVTCPWSASCLFVPRVSSASSSQLPSLYLVCFSFCVFCISPGSYFFFHLLVFWSAFYYLLPFVPPFSLPGVCSWVGFCYNHTTAVCVQQYVSTLAQLFASIFSSSIFTLHFW